jgi:hypothetical protein
MIRFSVNFLRKIWYGANTQARRDSRRDPVGFNFEVIAGSGYTRIVRLSKNDRSPCAEVLFEMFREAIELARNGRIPLARAAANGLFLMRKMATHTVILRRREDRVNKKSRSPEESEATSPQPPRTPAKIALAS